MLQTAKIELRNICKCNRTFLVIDISIMLLNQVKLHFMMGCQFFRQNNISTEYQIGCPDFFEQQNKKLTNHNL